MVMHRHRWLEAIRRRFRERWALVMESVALRHQVTVLQRSQTRRPYFRPSDRMLWLLLARCWPDWRDSLLIVQPETVLRWRRQGFRSIWCQRSAGHWQGGRPRIAPELRALIYRMSQENYLWGAPRIHGELLKLGFDVSQSSVSRYLRRRPRNPSQSWITFLRNQLGAARSTGYDDGWALVRGNASYDKRQSCAAFRDRIAKVEEKLQPLAGPRWIARPLQVQPNLTCAFPRQARSPPHVQLLPTGKRQWRVRHGGASTINRHTLPCAVPLESTEHRKIVICRTAGEQLPYQVLMPSIVGVQSNLPIRP